MACCARDHVVKDPREFQPTLTCGPVTEKFYARHECCSTPPIERVDFYEKHLDFLETYQAREHYKVPRYSNQVYGWHLCPRITCKFEPCTCDKPCETKLDKFNIREARQRELNCYLNYCNQKFARYRQSRWKIV